MKPLENKSVVLKSVGLVPTMIPLKGVRGAVARNMSQGWKAPQVSIGIEVNMTHVLEKQKQLQKGNGKEVHVGVIAYILHATALTLKTHPRMNVLLREKNIEIIPEINIAFAVSIENGLATPVIRNAETLTVLELAKQTHELACACRENILPPKAYQSGTFTITNLGATGIDWFTPILNPPQVGILGIGKVSEKPYVVASKLVITPTAILTLVFDHRAVDGYPAAVFLNNIKERLELCKTI